MLHSPSVYTASDTDRAFQSLPESLINPLLKEDELQYT